MVRFGSLNYIKENLELEPVLAKPHQKVSKQACETSYLHKKRRLQHVF